MAFTDTDKQALIELINNIQHVYSSDRAARGVNPADIILPCRLLRSAAEVAENIYQSDTIRQLDNSGLELLLASLSKAVEALAGSLGQVIASLPADASPVMISKLQRQAASLQELKAAREALFATAGSLSEQEREILAERQRLEALQQRHDALLAARAQLGGLSLEELRRMVSELDARLGPARTELELLQQEIVEKEAEMNAVNEAVTVARQRMGALDKRAEDEFAKLAAIGDDLLAGLTTSTSRCQQSINDVLREIAEKSAEGRQLREQLKAHAEEVHKVYEGATELADALNLYAASNHLMARSIPTVLSNTREKMSHIEEQLREVDRDLQRALKQHQTARRVADVIEL
jgi:chromosome segregation ATPase